MSGRTSVPRGAARSDHAPSLALFLFHRLLVARDVRHVAAVGREGAAEEKEICYFARTDERLKIYLID